MRSATPEQLLLALDLGTSSVRAVVCDAAGEPGPDALARREVSPRQDSGGRAEVDATAYLDGLVACLDELADQGLLRGVTDVATASQWHSVLAVDPVDCAGPPRSAVLPWLDTRAQPEPGRGPSDAAAFHARTGTWLHTLYWTAKIPWLREHLGSGRARFVGLPDYVRSVLLDDDSTSLSLASGTGLLDLAGCDWDAEALELAGVTPADLPALTEEPGQLSAPWQERWPDLADARWHPVLGDGAASNLGSGCGDSSTAALTVGTSAALRVVHSGDEPPPQWEVWRYRVDAKRLVSGIALSGGGVLNAWTNDLFQLESPGDPDVRPGAHGLVSVPLHAGSRPPYDIPPGNGAVLGLSLSTSADELRAATLEAVCLETARALDILETSFDRRFAVVLGGGAIHASPWWQRAFAATFDRPVRIATIAEVGARGAAALALGCDVSPPDQVVEPDADDVSRMAAVRSRYTRLRDFVTGETA